MKIKTASLSYQEVCSLPAAKSFRPLRPPLLFRLLLKAASAGDLKATNFESRSFGMEKLGKDEPCLILMNHSCFIDLKIASTVLYPRPINIVCTSDGFVGKSWLMRHMGCIPTNKFVHDPKLVRHMLYALKTLKSSVLMYPEAGYSFDGTATMLPSTLGKCLKLLEVPVVMIRTYGAFARDPLYNNLQLRDVKVSADVRYLLSPEDIKAKSVDELNDLLAAQFTFDSFRWQQENGVSVDEPFRADHLNRVLYKCPHCLAEGKMRGEGTTLKCLACGRSYELTEFGALKSLDGESAFTHVPDWYAWQRECVRKELTSGTYRQELDVDIGMLVDTKKLYMIGSGKLIHSTDGFHLTGDGGLDYYQSPTASYSLNSDYYWYEIGDMICIGDSRRLFYCFPTGEVDAAAKTRLATEELYKLLREQKKQS